MSFGGLQCWQHSALSMLWSYNQCVLLMLLLLLIDLLVLLVMLCHTHRCVTRCCVSS